jgi:hypothetical protein
VPEAPEVILPLPATYEPVTRVRSTLLLSSYSAVCEAGYKDAYLAALPQKFHTDVTDAVAGMWLSVEVGFAHYQACDALRLSRDARLAMGRSVEEKIARTLLGTTVRMAREVGVSPLRVIPHFQRFWNRAFEGGAIQATKVGPKEVNVDTHKCLLVDSDYFRLAFCGLTIGVLDLFCTKSYMAERSVRRASGTAAFRIQWS